MGIPIGFNIFLWHINIVLLSKIDDPNSSKRYFLSHFFSILLQIFNIVLVYILFKPPEINFILPLIGAIATNLIIIILSNSIILQSQKENAELEIQQLKVTNLEVQRQILLQQLQPHFLFNALSTLKSLISENPVNAEEYTIKLSNFLRYSILGKTSELATLEEELKFTLDYFDLQKVRFGNALQFHIEIPDTYLLKKIPVYGLQTLVENAIKHNSFTEKRPLTIHLSIDLECNKIKIENNKLPKVLKVASGTGLQNLNLRYKMISNTEIKIVETERNFIVFIDLL